MVTLVSWLTGFLYSLLAFIIILVPLVVFHEFGHYVFARLFNVKAEIFSVGFGPKIWSRYWGETEFRLSAIPLGGYVKLLGEDREAPLAPEEQDRALHKQKAWKRFFIFLGGPLFNFILAIFLFMAILMIGEPQVASVVGRVVQGSPAEKVGFQSGDRILSIDGKPVKKYDEVYFALNESPGRQLHFQVQHPSSTEPVEILAKTSSQAGFSVYGESTPVGEIDGLLPAGRAAVVGVSNPDSMVGLAGMKTGDRIVEFNQTAVKSWEEIESLYEKMRPGARFSLQYTRAQKDQGDVAPQMVFLAKPAQSKDLGADFGLHSSELFIEKVVPKSPAESAGIKTGDRLVSVAGQEVHSFFELKARVQESGEKINKVELVTEREGKVNTLMLVPTATATRDPVLNKTTQYTVGVMPMLVMAEPTVFIEKVWNPFKLVTLATERMVVFSYRNLVSLRKMFTGSVSMGSIGGPIMIGKIAGESMTRGLFAFLTNMAIFSIGLGVLNILPIPVLDGGHLLLLGVEIIRGKQLTLRQMEIVQGIGLIFILALMGIAFHNDLSRLIYS